MGLQPNRLLRQLTGGYFLNLLDQPYALAALEFARDKSDKIQHIVLAMG